MSDGEGHKRKVSGGSRGLESVESGARGSAVTRDQPPGGAVHIVTNWGLCSMPRLNRAYDCVAIRRGTQDVCVSLLLCRQGCVLDAVNVGRLTGAGPAIAVVGSGSVADRYCAINCWRALASAVDRDVSVIMLSPPMLFFQKRIEGPAISRGGPRGWVARRGVDSRTEATGTWFYWRDEVIRELVDRGMAYGTPLPECACPRNGDRA